MARSDICHISMWVLSGIRETKSQKVSWAEAAWGMAWCGSGFTAWHQVGKLDCILNEEHRHVVGHQIPVALIGVELDGKTAHVPGSVLGATLPGHGGESYEHRRLLALFGEGSRAGQMLEAVEAFEEAMGPGAAGMHDALGDALMVEVGDLLAKNEVLEQRRSAAPRLQRGLVIGDQHTLIGGQWPLGRRRAILVQ